MTRLTNNFTLEEFIKSNTAKNKNIDNIPNLEQTENIKNIANLLQIIRDVYKKPIHISSGFRSKELNKEVGGSVNSQHLEGSAADIYSDNNRELWDCIIELINDGLEVRQLIWEKGDEITPKWIHISVQDNKHKYKKNEILLLR